jgi:hypothetical protein
MNIRIGQAKQFAIGRYAHQGNAAINLPIAMPIQAKLFFQKAGFGRVFDKRRVQG